MHTSIEINPPEVQNLIEALSLRKSVFQLKARLLKGVKTELQAARNSGLTWLVIWRALRDAGYPGGYQNFCKVAASLMDDHQPQSLKKSENLPPLSGKKVRHQEAVHHAKQPTKLPEKPEWQRHREEVMARLDRDAEENRTREARWAERKKIFNPPPFKGRGEE
jgi:hypothetical protein